MSNPIAALALYIAACAVALALVALTMGLAWWSVPIAATGIAFVALSTLPSWGFPPNERGAIRRRRASIAMLGVVAVVIAAVLGGSRQ